MIETQTWMADVLRYLQETFGSRLVYLGLQGSYGRGEADEASDIDLVVLLDAMEPEDLDLYRGIVHAMPEGHKACGFISGIHEFYRWPRHELFPFAMDTVDHYGKLLDFLPPLNREDIRQSVHIGASALVHMLTHSYLYAGAEARPGLWKEACKSAFFVMRVAHYLASGVYCLGKRELLTRLDGEEREIVAAGLDFPAWMADHSENQAFNMLLRWSRATLLRHSMAELPKK